MARVRVAELEGSRLDAAVTLALGQQRVAPEPRPACSDEQGPLAVQAMNQRDSRHRSARSLALGQTCALNSAPCIRRWDLGCIGAHLFELVGTIVTTASARIKTGWLDAQCDRRLSESS